MTGTDNEEFASPIAWRGRSGRHYRLTEEHLESFVLDDAHIHLIAEGDVALWSGCAADIVDDQASRAGFRAAMKRATAAFSMKAPADDRKRMQIVWDLEGGQRIQPPTLVKS